eukprot:SAG31_NODE_15621_length_746_cov_1.017002_1_plen_67_part_01
MVKDEFVAAVRQLWGVDPASADAMFMAGDTNDSQQLSAHEYLLLREAFQHVTDSESAKDSAGCGDAN